MKWEKKAKQLQMQLVGKKTLFGLQGRELVSEPQAVIEKDREKQGQGMSSWVFPGQPGKSGISISCISGIIKKIIPEAGKEGVISYILSQGAVYRRTRTLLEAGESVGQRWDVASLLYCVAHKLAPYFCKGEQSWSAL